MGPNPRGKGQGAAPVAERVAPPPFRGLSAKIAKRGGKPAPLGHAGQGEGQGGAFAEGRRFDLPEPSPFDLPAPKIRRRLWPDPPLAATFARDSTACGR